jgi:hypothetical protein
MRNSPARTVTVESSTASNGSECRPAPAARRRTRPRSGGAFGVRSAAPSRPSRPRVATISASATSQSVPVRASVRHSRRAAPSARRREPWQLHDYQNWRRRTWHAARARVGIESLPRTTSGMPSLRCRPGGPFELAEQMGHSPQMAVGTYAHVIRELKGEPVVSARSRSSRLVKKTVDVLWTSTRSDRCVREHSYRGKPCNEGDSSAWIRTRDLTIMSRAL